MASEGEKITNNLSEQYRLTALASNAKPCPFCGERLVAKNDHHGWWVGHRQEPGPCFESVVQLFDESELKDWNCRAPSGEAELAALAARNAGLETALRDMRNADNAEIAAVGVVLAGRVIACRSAGRLPSQIRSWLQAHCAGELRCEDLGMEPFPARTTSALSGALKGAGNG